MLIEYIPSEMYNSHELAIKIGQLIPLHIFMITLIVL